MDRDDAKRFPDLPEENDEQRDSGTQAHDVAGDARLRATDLAEASERGGRPDRIDALDAKIAELKAARDALARLEHSCATGSKGSCPIIAAFNTGSNAGMDSR